MSPSSPAIALRVAAASADLPMVCPFAIAKLRLTMPPRAAKDSIVSGTIGGYVARGASCERNVRLRARRYCFFPSTQKASSLGVTLASKLSGVKP